MRFRGKKCDSWVKHTAEGQSDWNDRQRFQKEWNKMEIVHIYIYIYIYTTRQYKKRGKLSLQYLDNIISNMDSVKSLEIVTNTLLK